MGSETNRNRIKITFVFLALAGYVLAGSFLVGAYQHDDWPKGSVFKLKYGMGERAEDILATHSYVHCPEEGFCVSGNKMPLVPFFLSGVALLKNELRLAYLVKNGLFGLLLLLAILANRDRFSNLHYLVLLAAGGFLLSFPQILANGFKIEVEEGYTTWLIALLFLNLLSVKGMQDGNQGQLGTTVLLAFANSMLFLTKSSMFLLAIAFPILFYIRTRSSRVFLIFAIVLLVALVSWGMFNLKSSGRFVIKSSFDGHNFYKGNNIRTLSYYPLYTLDGLDEELNGVDRELLETSGADEWSRDQYHFRKAVEFIRDQPGDALKLLLYRSWIIFFEVRNTPIPYQTTARVQGLLQWLGIAYMLIFRGMFVAGIIYAFTKLVKTIRNPTQITIEIATMSIAYFLFLLAYTAPYLAGFAYERHVVPIIIPSVLFFLYMLVQSGVTGSISRALLKR